MAETACAIRAAAAVLAGARRAVALTGAGVSVPSGIPDYRSSNTGVWDNHDPAEAAHIDAFRRDPRPFYRAYRVLGEKLLIAKPNPAHLALARLEAMGKLRGVATQNIDSLHHDAGTQHLWELHGSLRTAHCLACEQTVEFRPYLVRLVADGEVPRCACGGVLKPDLVMFGEMLPMDVLSTAQREASRAEVCLAAGSSLTVQPAASLPWETVNRGGTLILANREATPLDRFAKHLLRGDVAALLPALADAMSDLLGKDEQ